MLGAKFAKRFGDGAMSLEEITLTLFAACNSFRVVAYVPQILKAANDRNGATSISFMTWFLFLLAHLSTVAYALINRSDWGLAACFAINAVCCVAILAIAYWKRRTHARQGGALCRPALSAAT
jgi:hypothetical protein